MVTTTPSPQAAQEEGKEYDLDSLMNKLMLMRAINRPSLSDVMVAPVGTKWEGEKPNGVQWTIKKVDDNTCGLVIND